MTREIDPQTQLHIRATMKGHALHQRLIGLVLVSGQAWLYTAPEPSQVQDEQ